MSLSSFKHLLAGLSLFACASAFAVPLTIDVAGVDSVGQLGNPGNTVRTYDIGANSTITSISYSLNLTAYSPSWLSQIGLAFSNSDLSQGVIYSPGTVDSRPGTANYADTVDLAALGLDFQVGSDGILRLEFVEDIDDLAGADGRWNSGTITFEVEPSGEQAVPEPASALLLGGGLAMMAYARRRRRRGDASKAAAQAAN